MSPPADRPSPQAAGHELLGHSASYDEEALEGAKLGVYVRDNVSLGPEGSAPFEGGNVLTGGRRESFDNFCRLHMREEEEVRRDDETYGKVTPYWDPVLGVDDAQYAIFHQNKKTSNQSSTRQPRVSFAQHLRHDVAPLGICPPDRRC